MSVPKDNPKPKTKYLHGCRYICQRMECDFKTGDWWEWEEHSHSEMKDAKDALDANDAKDADVYLTSN